MGIYELKVKTRNGEDFDLSTLIGKVSLVVNTATGCGFTPQYEAIEQLYEKYHDQGFEVLDFPCNQFGHQAPGTDDEIREFCTAKYQTKFDQFAKIDVNGANEDKVYTILKEQQPTEEVKGVKNKMAMKAVSKLSKPCVKKATSSGILLNFSSIKTAMPLSAMTRLSIPPTSKKTY